MTLTTDIKQREYDKFVETDDGKVAIRAVTTGGTAASTYNFNDQDVSGPTYEYYGFSTSSGSWQIRRIEISTSSVRYATGTSGYADAWTNRVSQTYGY